MDLRTEKRFKVHSMIQGMEIGETMDLELCEELIKKYGSSSDIDLLIEDNGNDMTYQEVVDLLNELTEENEHYKFIFFELIEIALKDKNCRELYCRGILDLFNKANSLNQAREMIKEHLE